MYVILHYLHISKNEDPNPSNQLNNEQNTAQLQSQTNLITQCKKLNICHKKPLQKLWAKQKTNDLLRKLKRKNMPIKNHISSKKSVKNEHEILLITNSNKQKTMPAKRSSLPWPVIKPIISLDYSEWNWNDSK